MYAMCYGTLPIVRRVGGVADTVADSETGFVFDKTSPQALDAALDRGLEAYDQGAERWRRLQQRAMHAEFGWERPAQAYLRVYQTP
jgi:starch synthase